MATGESLCYCTGRRRSRLASRGLAWSRDNPRTRTLKRRRIAFHVPIMTTFLWSSCAPDRQILEPNDDLFITRCHATCRRAGGKEGTNPFGKEFARTIKGPFLWVLCVARGVVPAQGTFDVCMALMR